jgi:1,2-diacylglycerol 3-beta-galactosyltransferase
MVTEALSLGIPVILTSYLPGQEAGNVEYVLRQGAGRFASTAREMVDLVRSLLEMTPAEWHALRQRARGAADAGAAYAIADVIADRAS